MVTSHVSDPKMSFKYYFLDNSFARTMYYAEELHEAVEKAKTLTNGERIEICPRYGGMFGAIAVVEPDGRVTDRNGNPLNLIDRHGNRL